MSLLEIRDIWRTYNLGSEPVHALQGLDLLIEKGEYVAIMGTS